MSRDIRDWLGELGLERYAEAFEENELDIDLLIDLSDADLKDLGVTAMGHRKKLLRAIEALSATSTPEKDNGEAAAASGESVPSPSAEAERRQLTVMFCDLVGSTQLSERLDPEDLRTVIAAFQEECARVISGFDGYIARYMGDGILIYFGYPQAHEEDAERAVRAGLGIVEAVAALRDRLEHMPQVRVGIATGLVVAGDIIGEGASEERAVLGETPNLAARLQGLADPDTVVVSPATWRLVDGLFEGDDLGPQPIKGLAGTTNTYRVRSQSDASSRFEASVARGLTPLVGRDEEIGLLMRRWEQARDSEGQVVLLSGEAGVGKSRIVRGLQERLENEHKNRILYQGSPYHENSALYPAIVQLERALRFERSNDAEQKLAKLEALLAELALPTDEYASLLAAVLSLPAERYPAIEASPQLLKQKTLEALLSVVEATTRQTPVLMVVEDAHWIDQSTSQLLDLLIGRIFSLRVLLIINHRPQFQPPWGGHAQVTMLGLNRLSHKDCAAMVADVAGTHNLSDEVVRQIVNRTDGIPLFVEELTKMLLESRLDGDGEIGDQGPPSAIPASIHDSLTARLDRLGPAKEMASLAAMLGRTFSHDLLAAVSPLDDAELEEAVSRLVAAELIHRRGVATEVVYEFKHSLVQDAAYQSLLKSSRQQHHARIARVMEESFPEMVNHEPEVLAHHFTQAGRVARAVDY